MRKDLVEISPSIQHVTDVSDAVVCVIEDDMRARLRLIARPGRTSPRAATGKRMRFEHGASKDVTNDSVGRVPIRSFHMVVPDCRMVGARVPATRSPPADYSKALRCRTRVRVKVGVPRPGLFRLGGIARELSALLSGRKVDLRTANDLSRYFRDDVVRSAEVQYAA